MGAPQQYGGRLALRLRHDVEAVVHAVNQIDICPSRRLEQRIRAGRAAVAIGMAGLVAAPYVGLRLRQAAHQRFSIQTAHQIFAQKPPCNVHGVT